MTRCKLRATDDGAVDGSAGSRFAQLRRMSQTFNSSPASNAFIAGAIYNAEEVDYYCPACGYHDGILDVHYDYEAVREELNAETLAANRELSMWRYLPLLPISSPDLIPHLQVGWTPLYEAPQSGRRAGRCALLGQG